MIIYPCIALRGGRCVNLLRGRIEAPVTYDADPVEKALEFAHPGAARPHGVDLDAGAVAGRHPAILRGPTAPPARACAAVA